MFNLIRMNLIKMFQMKCVYVMLILSMIMGTAIVLESQDTTMDELEQQVMEEQMQQGDDSVQVGLTMNTATQQNILAQLLSDFTSSGALMVMVGIFTAILACSERDSGFLKNLACCSQRRWQIVAARLLPAVLCTVIIEAGLLLSMLVTNGMAGLALPIGDLAGLIPVACIQLLLHTAFAAMVLLVVELTRNLMLSVIFSIFAGFGLIAFIISYVLPKLPEFMVFGRIKTTVMPLDMAAVPMSLIVGVVALAGYTVLSGLVFQKRDTY